MPTPPLRISIALSSALSFALAVVPLRAQATAYTDTLLMKARALAHAIPGELPLQVHYFPFGEFTAPLSFALDGAAQTPVSGVYAVFQIRYAKAWLMVDAGVDREVETDTSVHLDSLRYSRVQAALRGANLILLTHEHHDHVAGAIRTPSPSQVIPKTLLTRLQFQTLVEKPNSPLIRLQPADSARFLILDYTDVYPVAPGVVLIAAPGHTPGSQIVYVRLASGHEVLLIGDIAWMMAGIRERRQKPASISQELGENREILQQQLDWLSGISARQHIVVANAHDGEWLHSLVIRGVLQAGLDLTTH